MTTGNGRQNRDRPSPLLPAGWKAGAHRAPPSAAVLRAIRTTDGTERTSGAQAPCARPDERKGHRRLRKSQLKPTLRPTDVKFASSAVMILPAPIGSMSFWHNKVALVTGGSKGLGL